MKRRSMWVPVLLLLALVAPLSAAEAPEPPTLSVTGTAEVRVQPDLATVRLGVQSQAQDARSAQEETNRLMQRVIQQVRQTGIPQEQIQTAQLQLEPVYAPRRPQEATTPPQVVAYRATNTVVVRIEELNRVGRVIDAGISAGANNVEGIQFGLRDDLAVRTRALAEATREARVKADAIAGGLGVRIRGIRQAQEGGAIVRPLLQRGFAAESLQASTPVAPGQVTVSASVTVQYLIADR